MLTGAPPVVSLATVEMWPKSQRKVLCFTSHVPCAASEVNNFWISQIWDGFQWLIQREEDDHLHHPFSLCWLLLLLTAVPHT